MENNIPKEEWRKHFMELLGGEEVTQETEEEEEREELQVVQEEGKEDERELGLEEIDRAVRKLKIKKATSNDGIPMEAWKHTGGHIRSMAIDLLETIWKGGEMPSDWKKSILVPLYKRGNQEKVENYRGISMLCTAYKIDMCRNSKEQIGGRGGERKFAGGWTSGF